MGSRGDPVPRTRRGRRGDPNGRRLFGCPTCPRPGESRRRAPRAGPANGTRPPRSGDTSGPAIRGRGSAPRRTGRPVPTGAMIRIGDGRRTPPWAPARTGCAPVPEGPDALGVPARARSPARGHEPVPRPLGGCGRTRAASRALRAASSCPFGARIGTSASTAPIRPTLPGLDAAPAGRRATSAERRRAAANARIDAPAPSPPPARPALRRPTSGSVAASSRPATGDAAGTASGPASGIDPSCDGGRIGTRSTLPGAPFGYGNEVAAAPGQPCGSPPPDRGPTPRDMAQPAASQPLGTVPGQRAARSAQGCRAGIATSSRVSSGLRVT